MKEFRCRKCDKMRSRYFFDVLGSGILSRVCNICKNAPIASVRPVIDQDKNLSADQLWNQEWLLKEL